MRMNATRSRSGGAGGEMLEKLSLRLRVFLFFAALAVGVAGALILGLWVGYDRAGTPAALPGFVQAGLVAGFAALGLIVWVWYLFDINVARAIDILAGTIRARAHAEVSGGMDTAPARYLGDLAPAAAAVTETLAETRSALVEAVARETTRLSQEKARLEALLSDVPVGVLLCSGRHQLVFYNGHAVDLLAAGHAPGLNRTLFDYLREGPVRHAFARLGEAAAAGEPDLAADLLCATVTGARVLAGRMRLLDRVGDEAAPGYVLTLRDVTADMAAHARREALLDEVFDRLRRGAANVASLVAVQAEGGAAAVSPALADEAATLARAVVDLADRHDRGRTEAWPLNPTRASDLFDSLRARIEGAGLTLGVEAPALILRCDGFALVALLGALAERLAGQGAHDFHLRLTDEPGPGALFTLSWEGPALGVGALDRWLDGPLEVGLADMTGRGVLARHGVEMWPGRDAGRPALCLPIREARVAGHRPPPVARAVVYDFELLGKAPAGAVAEAKLRDLTFVVFDTETTGLNPASDEIVQIAAVRLVNGRRIEGEVFDTLGDPGRKIPPASTEVHGITDAMVAGAPDIAEAGRAFHRFAEGAVLVAHNAPFDLAFLHRHAGAIGARFDHPVLDTVLLSAAVFGQHERHTLDALCHRLGIVIPEEARHTAIGDTVATADAFLKLMPMLEGRGMSTFAELLAEVRRHGRLLRDMN